MRSQLKVTNTRARKAMTAASSEDSRRQTFPSIRVDDEKVNNLIKRQRYPTIIPEQSLISVYSNEEMKRIAALTVTNPSFEGVGSVNDTRMGSVDLRFPCGKCEVYDCPGHYGYIDFKGEMIYHPLFIKDYIVPLLKITCNSCGRLLFDHEYMVANGLTRKRPVEKLVELAKNSEDRYCLYSHEAQEGEATIRRCSPNPKFITSDVWSTGVIKYQTGDSAAQIDITTVYSIFDMMVEEDLRLLGFSHDSHPRNFILKGILVIPNIARPPNQTDGKRREDQLTDKYKTMVEIVNKEGPSGKIDTAKLYSVYRQFIFKEDKENNSGVEFQSVILRIQGKKALLRESLMGKRNNYTGRTVAGPDPSLPFGYMSVPQIWAPFLIKKVKATTTNLPALQRKLEDGKITHIIDRTTGMKFSTTKRRKISVGDTVCRYLEDDDWVVINRQPTLTKYSMMAYQIKLKPQLTIGNHMCVCTPMNLDFDGDEENLWNAMDNMVKAECMFVMSVIYNVISGSMATPRAGLVMNSITASYLINLDEKPMSEELFNLLLNMITTRDSFPTLFERLRKYGVHPRSGPAIFSALLPPTFHMGGDEPFIPKNYQGDLADLPRISTPVKIREGILITGKISKSQVGNSKRSIVQELWKHYGAKRTAGFLTDAPWILNRWIYEYGFSISLRDCVNYKIDPDTGEKIDLNIKVLRSELAQLRVSLKALGDKADDPTEENFRQQKIIETVDLVSGVGIQLVDQVLTDTNRIAIMTAKGAGTKGDKFNLAQIMSAIGQQLFNNDRIKPKTANGTRTLPMFDHNDPNPESQGLVVHSFLHGVRPEELFFMHEAGRQSLMDTALSTSVVGSIRHKLIKATEGIIIGYNGAVTNMNGTIFSTSSNCGYAVTEMLSIPHPTKDNLTFFIDVANEISKLNWEAGHQSSDLKRLIAAKVRRNRNVPDPTVTIDMDAEQVSFEKELKIPQGNTRPITYFEKPRIIGTRATQLENNAPTVLTPEELGDLTDSFDIALREYELGKCPVFAIRRYGRGNVEEVYPTLENK